MEEGEMIAMKFFKKKKDDDVKAVQDPITYVNRKKDHRIFLFSSSWSNRKPMSPKLRKGLRITALVALPICAVALGTGLGVWANQNAQSSPALVNSVVLENTTVKRRIYLISEDNYTVPLTVSLDKKNTVYEEMLDVINLLKVSSKASSEYLRGFIPDDARVNSFENEDGVLTIDFSEEFMNYTETEETRMMESLVATMTQFDGVDSLRLEVAGETLTRLPKKNTKVPETIEGINAIFSSPSLMENRELVTVFYQREYADNAKYLIPVSLYAESGESDNITFVNGLFQRLPSYRQLSNLSLYETISRNQEKKDLFSLTVNSQALIDENTVNKELYELVLLSLDLMGKEAKVGFDIEGETLAVEGIYSEEDQQVSSIYYNETEI